MNPEKGDRMVSADNGNGKERKEIEKLVQCYAHRWKIERFHFILKRGAK